MHTEDIYQCVKNSLNIELKTFLNDEIIYRDWKEGIELYEKIYKDDGF